MKDSLNRQSIAPIFLAWIAMLGFDFLLHAGLLASLYLESSPFLLSAGQSFARIPFGYLSFLLGAVLLVWLMARLQITSARQGAWFGLRLGGLIWVSLALGLYSISTASPALLLGWAVGQSVELGLGGMVAGAALGTPRRGRLLVYVLLFNFVAIVITIALQTLGLAPAVRLP